MVGRWARSEKEPFPWNYRNLTSLLSFYGVIVEMRANRGKKIVVVAYGRQGSRRLSQTVRVVGGEGFRV